MPDYRNRPPVDSEREVLISPRALALTAILAFAFGAGCILVAVALGFLRA